MPAIAPTYVYIIPKSAISGYQSIGMPLHYGGTIRDESKMGYAVLKHALKKEFGLTYDPKHIQIQPGGKPFIDNSPVSFNLSNCRDYIACAVGYQQLGVDIEHDRPIKTQLLGKFLTPEEIEHSFKPVRAWVIKEAYSKFIGAGIKLGFATVSADDLQAQHPHTVIESNDADYTCALFYANPAIEIRVRYTLDEEISD